MYFNTLDKKECSGCTACVNACPKQCISMKQDEEGFYYPEINKNLCINCGLCEKVCPFEHPTYVNNEFGDVYATYLKDIEQRKRSTSGGIFYAIARWVIEHDGIVYGAAFDENFKLIHIGVDNLIELEKLRGSKYLQSYLGRSFHEIRSYLQSGRWVYFTGVGCQVAGLKSFLRKEYKTLITSDLVCHGAPSQLMFDWHLNYLRNKIKAPIISYRFRDMDGWGVYESYTYVTQTGECITKRNPSYFLSPYLYAFMWAFNYRYSCYNCKFAKIPRQGDITLADYWGVATFFPELEREKGVSLILVNSQQGNKVWEDIKNEIEYRKSNIKDASLKNANLIYRTSMPSIRPICYNIIKKRGYEEVSKNEFRIKYYNLLRIKTMILDSTVGKMVKKLLGK